MTSQDHATGVFSLPHSNHPFLLKNQATRSVFCTARILETNQMNQNKMFPLIHILTFAISKTVSPPFLIFLGVSRLGSSVRRSAFPTTAEQSSNRRGFVPPVEKLPTPFPPPRLRLRHHQRQPRQTVSLPAMADFTSVTTRVGAHGRHEGLLESL